MAFDINELTSAQVKTTIQDLDGNALGSIDFLLATLYVNLTGAIVNSRVAQDINGANEGTFTSGVVTLDLSPTDTETTGAHTLHLEWGYDASANSTLSTPFDTSAADNTVTVNHTSHPFAVGDHVTFVDATETDGLNMNGTRTVATVPGANSYTFEHPSPATAGVTGGGGASVAYFVGSKVGRDDIDLTISPFVKVPTE